MINLFMGFFWWIINKGPKYGRTTVIETRSGHLINQQFVELTQKVDKKTKNPTITEPLPTQVEFYFYSNSIGKYSYQYPSNWKHSEIVNKDLNSPDQKILSVYSLITNPQYAPIFGSLEVTYQLDDGQCIEKDESFLKNMIVFKTKVGNQTVEAYECQELNKSVNRVIYERFIFIPRGDRCYKILILDQQGNPNSGVFEQILSSFKFLD